MRNIYEMFKKSNSSFYFTPKTFDKYESLLSEIFDIAGESSLSRDMKLYEMLVRLLEYTLDEDNIKNFNISNKLKIEPVKKYLEEHFVECITLDSLENQFNISKYYLSKLFKEEYDISIIAYINHLRINKSKGLLRSSSQKIESICHLCGIEDQGYFIRLFKKFEGVTPGEYRKIWSKY